MSTSILKEHKISFMKGSRAALSWETWLSLNRETSLRVLVGSELEATITGGGRNDRLPLTNNYLLTKTTRQRSINTDSRNLLVCKSHGNLAKINKHEKSFMYAKLCEELHKTL